MLNMSIMLESVASRSEQLLNETFVGREPVYRIQKAMDHLRDYILANPDGKVNGTDYERELETAIKDTFGFREVDVYWSSSIVQKSGPYTYPTCNVFAENYTTSPVGYGRNQKGIYDKNHTLTACIHMPANIFSYGITSEEAVAILLHELGHNFDITPNRLVKDMITVLNNILAGNFGTVIFLAMTTEISVKSYLVRLMELDTLISDICGPYKVVSHLIQRIFKVYQNVLSHTVLPILAIPAIPVALVRMPLNYIIRFYNRKAERYADSVAAMYGYGAEIASGLEKLVGDTYGANSALNKLPVFNIMYQLLLVESEILSIAAGGHESNQKRLIKMIDMLKQDLNDPSISPKFKSEIKKEIIRLENMYKQLMTMPDEHRVTLNTYFRRVMDGLYNGRPYLIVPSIGEDYIR